MRALRITAPACQDLEEISEYFLQSSVDAGASYKHLPKSANTSHDSLISASPTLNSDLGKRGILMMGYIVFYHVVEDDIEILRVVSGYRNLQEIFQND